jgi:hypothetical protein
MESFTLGYLLQILILLVTGIIIAVIWIFRPAYLADKAITHKVARGVLSLFLVSLVSILGLSVISSLTKTDLLPSSAIIVKPHEASHGVVIGHDAAVETLGKGNLSAEFSLCSAHSWINMPINCLATR